MEDNNFNIKIPLKVINNYALSPIALLLYGELYGLERRYKQIYIPVSTLSKRLNRDARTIRRITKQLKEAGLISIELKNHNREREIALIISPDFKSSFITVPSIVYYDTRISSRSKVVYGLLNRKALILKKIAEKVQNNNNNQLLTQEQIEANQESNGGLYDLIASKATIFTTNSLLAGQFKKTTRQTTYNALKELERFKYISIKSINGKGLEITLLPIRQNKCNDIKTTCKKNFRLPVKKVSASNLKPVKKVSVTCKENVPLIENREGVNREKNRFNSRKIELHPYSNLKLYPSYLPPNSEKDCISKPFYYKESIPPDNFLFNSPIPKKIDQEKDIKELNKLFNNKEESSIPIKQIEKKKELGTHIPNSKEADKQQSFTKPNLNIDYIANQVKNYANNITGKNAYIITYPVKELLHLLLNKGYTLEDFKKAISKQVTLTGTANLKRIFSVDFKKLVSL